MATKVSTKTTFEAAKTIQPIYTGGDVSVDLYGRLLATCVEEDALLVEIETGQPVARVEGDGEPITSICLSPSASHFILCSRSLSMRVYALHRTDDPDRLQPELLRTLKPHESPVVTTVIDETGTLLATGGADSTVKVWDIRGGFVTHTFHGHSGIVSALLFFQQPIPEPAAKPKGKRKSTNEDDNEARVSAGQTSIYLASAGDDGKVRINNLNSRKIVAILDSHVSVVRSLDFSAADRSLLSAGRDKTIVIWDTVTWKSRRVIAALEVLESAGLVLDGKYCYGGGDHGHLRLWNTATGQEITQQQKPATENNAIVAIVSSSLQKLILSTHVDQTIRIYSFLGLTDSSAEPIALRRRISGNHDEIIDMALVGPKRSLLALATNTESIRLISVADGTSTTSKSPTSKQQFGSDVALLEGHEDIIICLDVDWSGCWLATGAKDNNCRLWRLDPTSSSYTCFAIFAGHAESLGAIALPRTPPPPNSPAFKDPVNSPPEFLLTGSQDRTVKRWDPSKLTSLVVDRGPQTGLKALYTRVAHEKDINAIDVSPVAPIFASASQDRTIKIWSLDDGSVTGILRGHKRGVWSVRFSPADAPPINLSDGGTSSSRGLLVSGSGDRTVRVWSLTTYTCLLTFEGHSNSVLKVIWLSPPGPPPETSDSEPRPHHQTLPMIASASSDTLIKLWDPYNSSASSDHLLATLDNHSDRIWSLTTPSKSSASQSINQYPLISGAADATLTFWADTTQATALAASHTATVRIEQDQLLQNHIQAKNYHEVITLALALNHPGRLLRVFEDVVALPLSEREPGSIMGVRTVDQVLSTLGQEQLYTLLERVRDWNTNARTSVVAQKVLYVVLKGYRSSVFMDMEKNRRLGRGGSGMKELLRALQVYTERHARRMEELVDESYLIEYTLREMDEIAGSAVSLNGNNHQQEIDGDVIMV